MRPVSRLRNRRRALLPALLALCAGAPAMAQSGEDRPQLQRAPAAPAIADHVAEAARRFAIPEAWIWAVMRVESAGDVRAISRAGAMGLMQIMPATWAELRPRYGLGADPFHPRDNIIAGAAYLREMHDRFGSPGFLAAYNAGPGRYADHLATGRPLPRETRAYLAMLAPVVARPSAARRLAAASDPLAWTRAPLFPALARDTPTPVELVAETPADEAPDDAPSTAAPPVGGPPDSLFVARTTPRGS